MTTGRINQVASRGKMHRKKGTTVRHSGLPRPPFVRHHRALSETQRNATRNHTSKEWTKSKPEVQPALPCLPCYSSEPRLAFPLAGAVFREPCRSIHNLAANDCRRSNLTMLNLSGPPCWSESRTASRAGSRCFAANRGRARFTFSLLKKLLKNPLAF